ncbi:MAG TPA: hypothetical protein ENI15_17535, partial [Spirochaetes bacterium]|nr:hypothetical protein [Spirochaetota bacterium]
MQKKEKRYYPDKEIIAAFRFLISCMRLAGCVLGLCIILIYSRSAVALWIGTIITGFSMASLFPMTITFSERHLRLTGKITSMFLAGASIGSMFLPWFIGQF